MFIEQFSIPHKWISHIACNCFVCSSALDAIGAVRVEQADNGKMLNGMLATIKRFITNTSIENIA
jgi:hypothetical protein